MALSDILQVIASKKDEQIRVARDEFAIEEKNLLNEADKKGVEYSAQRFRDFEILKSTKEKKQAADTSRAKRIAYSDFQKSVMDQVFADAEKLVVSAISAVFVLSTEFM